ncbi:RNA-binding (RRM/RBD/RNP motifs) family protein [Trifolium repens]|nr:RNA-binding (RRM/RBD/RNP motifs) family protein [Trifolium repens]
MTQSESPKSSSSIPSSVLNVEGKRVLEDVGGSDPSKLPKTSSSQDVGGRVPDITLSGLSKTFEKVEGKHVADRKCPIPGFELCPCCPFTEADYADYVYYGKYSSAESKYYGEMLGDVMVPSFLFPLIQEMADKSDDKTLVVSNITRDIRDNAKFLALFQPYGKVESAKLLPCHSEKDFLGDIGFVTFESKKDAQQAMYELNGAGPRGKDGRVLILDWASILKRKN